MKKPIITVLGLCGRSVFMQVDHFHVPGETVHARGIHIEPGGKGYNQAVAAARLGAEVNFITCCGRDDDAAACRSFLEAEGINPLFEYTGNASTAFATILTDSFGDNRVTVYRGAADCLSAEFVRGCEGVIAGSDILLLNFECPAEANEAALDAAERHGVMAILNPAPAVPCGTDFLSRFWCITPNESEARVLNCETRREIITLGGEGVLVRDCGKNIRLPAFKAEPVDTTGAGDCFNGALAVAVAEGMSLVDAAEFAQKAAALSVSRRYVMPSLPPRSELDSFNTASNT